MGFLGEPQKTSWMGKFFWVGGSPSRLFDFDSGAIDSFLLHAWKGDGTRHFVCEMKKTNPPQMWTIRRKMEQSAEERNNPPQSYYLFLFFIFLVWFVSVCSWRGVAVARGCLGVARPSRKSWFAAEFSQVFADLLGVGDGRRSRKVKR